MRDAHFEVVIIGGGIVGLATALEITRRFPKLGLAVLEKEDHIAAHQSGHNSGVIHSGIYYRPGSLKARLCVEGAAAMIEFCKQYGIPHQVCGKLIVATCGEEVVRLEQLLERGRQNGVPNIRLIDGPQVRDLEPHCAGIRGLHVPSAAITDYSAVCGKFAELIHNRGGKLLTNSRVTGLRRNGGDVVLETTNGVFSAGYVINCAGLHSDEISRISGEKLEVTIVPFRGEYYSLAAERTGLVRGMIYPVPDPELPFLRVHFTRRVHGGVDAGPNAVLALSREGYSRSSVSPRDLMQMFTFPGFWRMVSKNWRTGTREMRRSFSKQAFLKALQRLVPELQASDLRPGGSGVRAQAVDRDGSLVDDFLFVRSNNMLHVCNVPSPAATASLPIGRVIARMALEGVAVEQAVRAD